jgi:hypothetical protein
MLKYFAMAAVVVGAASTAYAKPIKPAVVPLVAVESQSCETGCSNVLFGGAIWSTDDTTHPSGTGVFKPFLRLQANGRETTEDGHNTDAKKGANDEKAPDPHTHSVLVSDLAKVTVPGYAGTYFVFELDTGEPANDKKSPLSLDSLKVCTGGDPEITKADDCPYSPYKYDLDAGKDREVLLDYALIGRGNGESDLFVYVPSFTTTDKYLFLYSLFGSKGGAYQVDGTFSEWRFLAGPAAVPEPASMLLFGTGASFLAWRRRRGVRG